MPDLNTSGSRRRQEDGRLHRQRLADLGRPDGQLRHRYDLGYSYQSNGASRNLTGSPDYGARIVYVGDPGGGCSDNQYAQFNVAPSTGPGYGSVGLESGRNLCRTAPTRRSTSPWRAPSAWAAAVSCSSGLTRSTRSTSRSSTGARRTIQFDNPTSQTVLNAQYNADGTVNSDASAAAQRRLRRGNGRAEHAQLPGDDSLPVLARISTADQASRDADHTDHVSTGRGSRG